MQAVILAAGMGTRLKELTQDNTKCMVEVNGKKLIQRTLEAIDKYDFSKIIIVGGYKRENLKDFVNSLDIKTPIVFIDNPIFDTSNNIYSLALAADYLEQEDTITFESDLIFDDTVIKDMIEDKRDSLALVDKFETFMDGTILALDDEDRVLEFTSSKVIDTTNLQKEYYKTINIYKFSKEFSKNHYMPALKAHMATEGGMNDYYETVLKTLIDEDFNLIYAKKTNGQIWYEIDNATDLAEAEKLFK